MKRVSLLAVIVCLAIPTFVQATPVEVLTDSALDSAAGSEFAVDSTTAEASRFTSESLNPEDPLALAALIIKLVGDKQWLLVVPVGLVLLILGLRRFGGRFWPFLDTPRGGAVLTLGSAFALAFWAAAAAPGAVGWVHILVAAFLIFLQNELVHKALKTLFWPDGKEMVEEADAAGKALEASDQSAASKVNEAIRS